IMVPTAILLSDCIAFLFDLILHLEAPTEKYKEMEMHHVMMRRERATDGQISKQLEEGAYLPNWICYNSHEALIAFFEHALSIGKNLGMRNLFFVLMREIHHAIITRQRQDTISAFLNKIHQLNDQFHLNNQLS
ncbi:hypothetical protein ACJX0J_034609, partial [Zea mays]